MHPEAMFLTGYALTLVAVAAGLESLGRRSTRPWASRMLAACRPADDPQPDDDAGWIHSEVPAFHTGLGGVALAAALALTIVSTARHHGPVELAAQGALLLLIGARVLRLVTRHRVPGRDHPPRSVRDSLASPEGGGAVEIPAD